MKLRTMEETAKKEKNKKGEVEMFKRVERKEDVKDNLNPAPD